MTKVRSELDPSSRFDKTPTCDRRTHRQTQGNSKYRAVKIVTTRARDLAINDIKTTVHLADYGRHRSHVFRGNHLPSHERSVCQSLLAIFLLRRLHHAAFHHFGTDLGYCRNCYLGRLKSINQSINQSFYSFTNFPKSRRKMRQAARVIRQQGSRGTFSSNCEM